MSESITWPVKQRELHNHHFDSTVWNDLEIRDGDIVASFQNADTVIWYENQGGGTFGAGTSLGAGSRGLDHRRGGNRNEGQVDGCSDVANVAIGA